MVVCGERPALGVLLPFVVGSGAMKGWTWGGLEGQRGGRARNRETGRESGRGNRQ